MQRFCTIKGYLYGVICEEFKVYDYIGEAEIFAVRSRESTPTAGTDEESRGDLKKVVRYVADDELRRIRADKSVLTGKTDEDGKICLNGTYQGELLDVYVCINSVPLPGSDEGKVSLDQEICLFLGTYAPRKLEDAWYLKLVIPQYVWCAIKKKADAWTIAGRVATCDADKAIGNVTVTAFDVDWKQQDELGSAVTNGIGIFRIDYPGDKFRKGTFIDVELFGGPDVYFLIKDSSNNTLLEEDPSVGRWPGRNDSEPCMCVNLCVVLKTPTTNEDDISSAWISVGTQFLLPDSTSVLHDFDADGYAGQAGIQKFVLTSAPAMRGGVPRTNGGHPVEYRFLVSDTTAPNTSAPLGPANFTRIVGAGTNTGLFAQTDLGVMYRIVSFAPSFEQKTIPINALLGDLDADGWLNVNRAIENSFIRAGEDPSTIPLYTNGWIPSGKLMHINTGPLTTAPDVPGAAAETGNPVPVANHIAIKKIAVRFETREVVSGGTNLLPASGRTLNSMLINNNNVFCKAGIVEQISSGNLCDVLHTAIHVAYTVYHPHLESAQIQLKSNSGAYDHNLNDPEPPSGTQHLPLSGNINPAITGSNNPNLNVPAGMTKCAYWLQMTTRSRRHTGEAGGQVSEEPTPLIVFYFEP